MPRFQIKFDILVSFILAILVIDAGSKKSNADTIVEAANKASPFVQARTLIDGNIIESSESDKLLPVFGCCSSAETTCYESEESCVDGKDMMSPVVIGNMPQFTEEESIHVLEVARKAWKNGSGVWPQMSLKDRIIAIENFLTELKKVREEIVTILMWEIGKNRKDAESEFDRTILFVEQSIAYIRSPENPDFNSDFNTIGSTRAFIRRAAIGIIMCLGPYNYPLNETYATLIPALLMGNIVIMKIPTIGGLAHLISMEAFSKTLPPGTVNFISGGGRVTMPPLMRSGHLDGLAFIGGSSAADKLISQHPEPHRLKLFLQLEAKNMGIFLPDMFDAGNEEMLDRAISEAITGSLSFNGQRCTALKLLYVPKAHASEFAKKMASKMERLRIGLPWQKFTDEEEKISYAQITPLPNSKRIAYMQSLIKDAISKGAQIMNANGGEIVGGDQSTLMIPALLYPVDNTMNLYEEEQFGPVVPIATYDDIDTVLDYGQGGKYGQQCSIFTTGGGDDAIEIIDRFSSVFGKINLNSQCGRSPDSLPFSGRRSSALGVMSIVDALREFSVPTVISYKQGTFGGDLTEKVAEDIYRKSNFMQSIV